MIKKNSSNNKKLLVALEKMMLIRKFEETAASMYLEQEIRGFCHLCIGQEAIPAATYDVYKKGDQVITSYRCHGFMVACGAELGSIMAELLGKETGCSKGKGGSMHMFDPENGFYGGHGIVGAQVPLGTGLAFSNQYKKNKNVCFTFFGDGAANQGQVYESFNMAALWKLPVIYIIENNEYAMGTALNRGCANSDQLYKRGEPFGIPGVQVDGMNFITLQKEMKKAREHAIKKGPILLEIKTYRYKGHSMSDPAKYRTNAEVDQYRKKRDPILQLQDQLLKDKTISENDMKNIQKKVREEVNNAVKFAQNSALPHEGELMTNIYCITDN